MTILHKLALGAGLALALGASQCVPPPPPAGGGYGVPPGSYLSTCRNARIGGRGNLRAECRDRYGRWVSAFLALPCRGDIVNRNGSLVCRPPDRDPRDTPVPDGPYRSHCGSARVNRHNVLVATCRRQDGRWVESRLQLPCRGTIDYRARRGDLVCRAPEPEPPAPPPVSYPAPDGPYRNHCGGARVTQYDVLVANCYRQQDGQWQESRLQLPCNGAIDYRHGNLVCDDGRPDRAVPAGPYLDRCRDARVNRHDMLVAECRRRDTGQWVESRLQLPCHGEVVFRRGRLRCRY